MNSSLMLRRFFCCNAAASSATTSTSSIISKKKPLVFLGSPQVSATVLDALFNASSSTNSSFEQLLLSRLLEEIEVERCCLPRLHSMLSTEAFPLILFSHPNELERLQVIDIMDMFLSELRALQPELCITAAYGNILPSKFLNIPPQGTVNIHPSLLPLYRGAAPVQRALQDGVRETGVSLAYTVRALDAGPVIACEKMEVDDHIKAPDLLALLFSAGSKLLIHELPSILDGSAKAKALPQDDAKVTLAPKIAPEESWLSFDQEAPVLHNKVRAFAGWPGTRAKLKVIDDKSGQQSVLELKVITTRVCSNNSSKANEVDDITFVKGALVFPCGGSTELKVLEVQLPGKKVVNAASFWNGLRGQRLKTL